eukprot:3961057-Prymnesium_polylepis.1
MSSVAGQATAPPEAESEARSSHGPFAVGPPGVDTRHVGKIDDVSPHPSSWTGRGSAPVPAPGLGRWKVVIHR